MKTWDWLYGLVIQIPIWNGNYSFAVQTEKRGGTELGVPGKIEGVCYVTGRKGGREL